MALTARDVELLKMSAIAEQMPLQFDNGFRWTTLSCNCFRCGQAIEDERVKGMLTKHTPHMAVLEAIGNCPTCELYTRFLYRIYDDKRIMGPQNGKWQTWQVRRNPFYKRVLYSLRRVLSRVS
jgi:hypothetical protein